MSDSHSRLDKTGFVMVAGHFRFFASFMLLAFGLSCWPIEAPAQSEGSSAPQQSLSINLENLPRTTKSRYTDYNVDDDVIAEDGYIKPTYERLSQLYWFFGINDLKDDEAIDGYLMIHECDLYRKFFTQDFELEALRDATRDSILHNLSKFPVRYEIFMPLGLDRYVTSTKVFKVDPTSDFISTKKLEYNQNSYRGQVCGRDGSTPKHPRNFIVGFNRPFSLTDIPVDEDVAQAFIDYSNQEAAKGHVSKLYDYRELSTLRRIAFIRLKVTLTQFIKMDYNTMGERVPLILANIDGFQIYGDQDRNVTLYDREAQNKKRQERLKAAGGRKKIVVPDGPLMQPSKQEFGNTTVPQNAGGAR